MESVELLNNIKATPGEDVSWLERGWIGSTCLSPESRPGIIDWLIQCQQYLGLPDSCVHSAIANFDIVLCKFDWDLSEIQLLALASLQLSSKMEVDAHPASSLLLPLAGDVYSKADLARVELELFQALDWRLRQTTPQIFLEFFADISVKGRKPLFKMAKAVLDLCLYQEWYGCEKPSIVASSCLAAACCLTSQPWCDQLTELTGNCLADLGKGLKMCLLACTGTQCEGFEEKHGKCGRNIKRLQPHILHLLSDWDKST